MLNVFFTKFYKIKKKQHEIMLNAYIQSITDNLKDRYWNMGPGNERGNELGARRAWKLYFNPWAQDESEDA